MKEQLISNTGIRISKRYDGTHLTGVTEYLNDVPIREYLVNGNVLEKWSKDPCRSSRIEFASDISLRFTEYGESYSVNACEKGGAMPPPIIHSIESRDGILRHFNIKQDILLDWMRRSS